MSAPMPRDCRHCHNPFIPLPGKPGYIDECPECLLERMEEPTKPKTGLRQLRQLLEYMASHPLTAQLDDGRTITFVRRTEVELRGKLQRKHLGPESIDKLMKAYRAALVEMQ